MPFTFKAEDGTGYTDSNSFATVAQADDYLELDIHEQSWVSLDISVKEKLLALATRYMVQRYNFIGEPTLADQALPFPATDACYKDGTPIEVDVIPLGIIEATIEWARLLQTSAPRSATATQGLKRIEVDVIELEFDTEADIARAPDLVDQLLKPFAQQKGRKPTFAKIKRS